MSYAVLSRMGQSPLVAEQFLAVYRGRADAPRRAERFIKGLMRSQVWQPDELEELRRLIDAGLEQLAKDMRPSLHTSHTLGA